MTKFSEILGPFHGVRAINAFFCVFLSTIWSMTANLPCEGPLIQGLKNNPIYRSLSVGRVHGDMSIFLSGFLFTYYLLGYSGKSHSLPYMIVKRCLVIIPSNLVFLIACSYVIEDPWNYLSIPQKLYSVFMASYLDTNTYLSFFMNVISAHCTIDLHISIVVIVLYHIFVAEAKDLKVVASRLASIFVVLIIIGLTIRGLLFEKSTTNEMLVGRYYNIAASLNLKQYHWITENYNHKWVVKPEDFEKWKSSRYFDLLHYASHSRYNPFCVGGLLACNVILAHLKQTPTKATTYSTFSTIIAWIVTVLGLYALVWPSLPGISFPPVWGQLLFTSAFRTVSIGGIAVVLFRAMVPESHPWHISFLKHFLSSSIWIPFSVISICNYLVHYKILLELTFSEKARNAVQLTLPTSVSGDAETVQLWMNFLLQFIAVALVLSFTVGTFLHLLVERPVLKLLELVDGPAFEDTALGDKKTE